MLNILYIDSSLIHGNGLFIKQDIKKGTKLFQYIGEEMSLREFKEKYGEYKLNSLNTYRMKRINKILVAKEEPFKSNNLINWINESNEPNCILKNRWLIANREIKSGEELTLKYPNDYYRNY